MGRLARSNSDAPLSSVRSSTEVDAAQKSQLLTGVKVYSQDPAYVAAVAGRYVVYIVKQRTTAVSVSLLRRAYTDLSEAYPTFGCIAIVEPEAQFTLAPDLVESVNALVKRFSTRFTGLAVVYEKSGFQATALRSVLTAINFASRSSYPNHVFSDVRQAISWIAPLTPGEPTPTRLQHLTKILRESGSLPNAT